MQPVADAHLPVHTKLNEAPPAARGGSSDGRGCREGDGRCWVSWRLLPFCWECGGGWWCGCTWWCGCVQWPRQGKRCTCAAVCSWCTALTVVGVGIFFLAIFWSCLTMPEGSIVRGEEVVASANAVLAISAQQHGHHSASARERASQGQVRVISYNFFLRPDLLTVMKSDTRTHALTCCELTAIVCNCLCACACACARA